MNCTKCGADIEHGDSYVAWGGFEYCGTACVVDELVEDDGMELKVREDNRPYNGTHFPNVQ